MPIAVMVNCMCPLDNVMGWPDIWFSFTLGVSLRVLLDEITFE